MHERFFSSHERFFSSREFSYEKCSEIFPEIFEPLFCGSEKIPGKFPPNFPQNFPNFPAKNQKKIHRRASAGAQGELLKFLGAILLGHQGPRRWDIPDKNFMLVTFFCCFRQGVAGMSRDLGRDVLDLEKPTPKNHPPQ